MPKSLKWALFVAVVFAAIAGQATGTLAGSLGNIAGRVETVSTNVSAQSLANLPVPLALVNVTAVAPSGSFKAQTNDAGYYALTGLAPDTYVVTFAKQGYVTVPYAGITVTQDSTYTLNVKLQSTLTKLGTFTVRGATSLVQPNETSDKYTVTPSQIQNITGTPQNISETAVLNSLPGITTDNGGYPIIRGGAENDEGYQLEGIDATEPVTGQFINSLSLAGLSRLVVATGGYDVSNGNTNSGVVNEVIKRGSYPGSGQFTVLSNAPNFDHRFAIEYGNGTADNRFSYYYAFSGLRQVRVYGDQHTFLPRLIGQVGDSSGNENVLNLFYRWGTDNRNELQYLGETGANLFDLNNNVLQYGGMLSAYCNTIAGSPGTQTCLPYGSANQLVWATVGQRDALATELFPGQTAAFQGINYPDAENNQHFIQKLNYKRQFSSNSYGDLKLFRTNIYDHFMLPWDGGAFGDFAQQVEANNLGIGIDYQNQFSNQHLVAFGAETIFTTDRAIFGGNTVASLIMPNTRPYIGPLINLACINTSAHTINYSCTTPTMPLSTWPSTISHVNHPVHRGDVWVQDTWTPSDHFNIKAGLRFDQEILHIPSNANVLSTSFTTDASGNVIDVVPAVIGRDVTRPSQVSPRLAFTFTPNVNARNVFRASVGTNIEFTPLANIEDTWAVDPRAFGCTIASGCFTPLQAYSPTCVNGADPAAAGAPCNGISNLAQQIVEELNTNNFAQYTPVKPQRALNADFSWTHDWTGGLETRVTPYYRRGMDYVVANTPLITTLLDGTPVFGAPREENSGENRNFGVELAVTKSATFGWSGFLNGTYDNTLANYNSDFFPSVNNAALALHHFFHVSYLAPVTATLGVTYHDRHGLWVTSEFPYESGYRYGVGKKTFVFQQCGAVAGCTGSPLALVPVMVLNTDMAAASLGLNANTSAYYFTDPINPGTILNPNITGSRGTQDGDDPGTLRGPQRLFVNLSVAHDIGNGPNHFQVGVRATNLLGNYTNAVVGGTSRYRNNGLGGFNGIPGCTSTTSCGNGSTISGSNTANPSFQPLQFPRGPFPYENEATGPARLFTFFVSSNF